MDDNESGPEVPITTSNNKVVNFSDFKKNVVEGKKPWPTATEKKDLIPITITKEDPKERKILLSLTHGDVLLRGHLGLSNTFLAVGDKEGQIRFAAAPGMWLYAKDVTDDPDYADGTVTDAPPDAA